MVTILLKIYCILYQHGPSVHENYDKGCFQQKNMIAKTLKTSLKQSFLHLEGNKKNISINFPLFLIN